ncbi:Glucan endo-1,3-beta-glucosidase 13 [Morus notabilis]|uniref:glucan endo-1,3-beta-D-glucosidase n=1 Tax=Morus notabilis TaxID=981085 RepID=W9RXA1_9ROSA|nr:glucan endo-1,3-beta-glucosidase 12 [Morus notabilis]EXB76107.1 Glucan endo-1,3-beta-glucosidase 13 [Morus notabilis]
MSLFFLYSLTLSLYSLSLLPHSSAAVPLIGATYSLPSSATPSDLSASVSSLGLDSVLLDSPDPSAVRAFLFSNTSLLLSLNNSLAPSLAANRSAAASWLSSSVVPFFPRAKISAISVGSDLLSSSPDLSPFLLPAMRNLHLALTDLGIRKIQVSTTFSFLNTLTSFFPPSSAQFLEPASSNVIAPLLQFLRDTNSSFLIDLYPYNVYRTRSEIPLGYALFQEQRFNFRDDLVTGVRYRNLFDMMVDAVICAMVASGYDNIPVVVAETGWPSASGDPTEADANPAYAELYLRGLVRHLRSGIGTPLRKEGVAEAYIYELFDREEKQGRANQSRSWGILYPNMTSKYAIDFSGSFRDLEGGDLVVKLVWLVVLIFGVLDNGFSFGCFVL